MFEYRKNCPACNSSDIETKLETPFDSGPVWSFLKGYYGTSLKQEIFAGKIFTLSQCNYCELVFQANILNPMGMDLLYSKWICPIKSKKKAISQDINYHKYNAVEILNISNYLNKLPKEIKILEFGMGWGQWSLMAKAFGYDIVGAELCRQRIDYAKQNSIHTIGDVRSYKEGKFNFIYSNQVFEHLSNPQELLVALRDLLEPNGIIQIRVPNGKRIIQNLSKGRWKPGKDALHPLEHINCFTNSSLKRIANSAGLTNIRPNNIKQRNYKTSLKNSFHQYMGTNLFFKHG